MRHTPELAVALMMTPEGLLTMRRPGDDEKYIDLPTGQIEVYEKPHQAVARQLKDDLGLTVRTWKDEGHIDIRSPQGLATVHIVRAAVDGDDRHCIESSSAYCGIRRLDQIDLTRLQRAEEYELSPTLTQVMTLMTNGEVQRAAAPVAVALITNEDREILVGKRHNKGRDLQELELLGGRIKNHRRPDLTVEERVRLETGVHAPTQERCMTLFFEDDGVTREAQLWNAHLTSGDISPENSDVHEDFEYHSRDEIKRRRAQLSPLLRELVDTAILSTLELKIEGPGQRIWRTPAVSGIK